MIAADYPTWFPDEEIDGTYGFDEGALRRVAPVPAPEGFAALWRGWNARIRAVAPRFEAGEYASFGTHEAAEIRYTAGDGTVLGAWIARPRDRAPRVVVVHSHGYGGRERPEFARVPDDAAVVFPLARGLGALNTGVGAPSERDEHVLFGIDDPQSYVLGACVRDLWLTQNIADELWGPLPHYLVGESFGGGVGALALPWDDRFIGATLVVPSFGQYDERLVAPCHGSGEAVRRYAAEHPEARGVLRLFDASSAATFARVPVRIEAALWDAHVPPPGQFGVAAGFRDRELMVLPAGHAEYPGLTEVRQRAIAGGVDHLHRSVARVSSDPR
ncbi:acetylxylan esterase [Microbacterium sp. ZW T5_56]|uniref:acetylxylan esterase n=1 Tax=Microbacterium sp. ZW T5_56 TaxID=3378081 RepID=UPI003851BB73